MDRRVFVMGTVVGAGTVAASGCNGGSSAAAATPASGSALANQGAAPITVETPISVARPRPTIAATLRVNGRYRTDQAQLFLTPPPGVVKSNGASYWETPARASVASPKAALG